VGVADELLANIRAKALGSEVMLQLAPDQQVVKIVRDELLALLGKHRQNRSLRFAPAFGVDDRGPARLGQNHHHRQARQMARAARHRPLWFPRTCIARQPANSSRQGRQIRRHPHLAGAQARDKPLEIVRGAIREAKLSASDVILVGHRGPSAH